MTVFFITVILWVSFIPAAITERYKSIIYLILILFLTVSFFRVKSKRYFLNDKLDKLVWLFLLANLLSVIFAYNKDIAFERYKDFVIPFIALYFISKNELNSDKLKVVISALFITGVAVAVMAILEFMFNRNIIYEKLVNNPFYQKNIFLSRAMSTMMHPAILGTYLLCCLAPSYFILGAVKDRIIKALAILGSFVILTGLMLSFSRTSWVSALIVTVFYFYRKNKKILPIVMVFVTLFSILILGITKLRPLVSSRISYENLVNDFKEGYRLERYLLTIKIVKDHPFIGVGLNNYRLVFDKYYGSRNVLNEFKIPDNMYLMVAGESGLIGLGLFLLFLFYMIKRGFMLLKDRENKNWELRLVLFSGLIGIFINMISYDMFYWTSPFFLFLLFLGGMTACSNSC